MHHDIDISTFNDWIQGTINRHMEEHPNTKEVNVNTYLLCKKPSQRDIRYKKMRAFGNHFRIEDATLPLEKTYDSGEA